MGRPGRRRPGVLRLRGRRWYLGRRTGVPCKSRSTGDDRLYDRDAMADRLERLTNLVAVLLETGRPLTLEEIVERVPGYPAERESYRRQFERDKSTLREIGVPISLEALYAFDQETGYRIHREDYELPRPRPDRRRAGRPPPGGHRRAARRGAGESAGGAGRDALLKLGGPRGHGAAPRWPRLPDVPALPALFDAYRRRARVTFTYRGERPPPRPLRDPLPQRPLVRRRATTPTATPSGPSGPTGSSRPSRPGRPEPSSGPTASTRPRPCATNPGASATRTPVEALVLVSPTQAGWVEADLGEQGGGRTARRRLGGRAAWPSPTGAPSGPSCSGSSTTPRCSAPPELRADMVAWLTALAGGQAAEQRRDPPRRRRPPPAAAHDHPLDRRPPGQPPRRPGRPVRPQGRRARARPRARSRSAACRPTHPTGSSTARSSTAGSSSASPSTSAARCSLTPGRGLRPARRRPGAPGRARRRRDGSLASALGKLAGVLGAGDGMAVELGPARYLDAAAGGGRSRASGSRSTTTRSAATSSPPAGSTPGPSSPPPAQWYVDAYCHRAGDDRLFRVDRVRGVRPTGEHFDAADHRPVRAGGSVPSAAFGPASHPCCSNADARLGDRELPGGVGRGDAGR